MRTPPINAIELPDMESDSAYDPSTIRMARPKLPEKSHGKTPSSASTSTIDSDAPSTHRLGEQEMLSPPKLLGRPSMDTLSSAPTSKSQPAEDPRRPPVRRPGGSVGDGLRGFQFPLVAPRMPDSTHSPLRPQPPSLHRMHSAAPALASPVKPPPIQIPIAGPSRPPMMRQASVAVMEGRAASQTQAQAEALALVGGDSTSPTRGLPLPPAGRFDRFATGTGMVRTRSGSRADDMNGSAVNLRDLIKVSQSHVKADGQLSATIPDQEDLLPPSPTSAVPPRYFPQPSPLSAPPPLTATTIVSSSGSAGNSLGPPVRPLDLGSLEGDEVFAELERTVEDLGAWLELVSTGLEDLCAMPWEDGEAVLAE